MTIQHLSDPEIRIAIVGDVHEQWSETDAIALGHLGVDLVLFVGDFGNEVVSLVEQVASLTLPKAVVLGNHDAWYSATKWGRKKCPYDRRQTDWVQKQLDALGNVHVGYAKLDFPDLKLTIVGGRPFSWGGPNWRHAEFYRARYGVDGMEASQQQIMKAVDAACFDTLLFLGHCGPSGLGDQPEAICGRDWKPSGGDFGDPDLAAAIAYARAIGKSVPLVSFGHMHHSLRHRQDRIRERYAIDAHGTTYLNAACVPRWRDRDNGIREHNFSLVTLRGTQIERAVSLWITTAGKIVTNEVLFERTAERTAEQITAAIVGNA